MPKNDRVVLVAMCVLFALGTHPFAAPSDLVSATTPYAGVVSLPGTIQAANFDNGGEGLAYHDTSAGNSGGAYRSTDVDIEASNEGGFDIGWIMPGEWLKYSVNAPAGTYLLEARVASGGQGGTFHIEFGGTNVTGALTIPNTGGWQTWMTISKPITIAADAETMRIAFDTGGSTAVGNVSWIRLTPVVASSSSVAQVSAASTSAAAGTTVASVPTGGWQNWTTVSAAANLADGQPPLEIVFDTSGFKLARVVPSSTAPGSYNAVTDRIVRTKPVLPSLGPAGFTFTDPAFGSPLLRVTDALTRPSSPNLSYRTPSAGQQVAWGAASTYFYVTSTDGTIVPYSFDSGTMRAARIPGPGDGGLTLNFYVEPEFSSTKPSVVYGVTGAGNRRTVSQYDLLTGVYAPLIDLDTLIDGLSGYVGGLMTAGTPTEYLMVICGGDGQDQHRYLVWSPMNNFGARKVVDTVASTINGEPTTVPLNFHIHAAAIDRSGRYVYLYPTAGDLGAPRSASQAYLWDTSTNVLTPITTNALPGGHGAPGYGVSVNHDCCAASSWDAGQWIFRSLADPLVVWDLIGPVLTPQEVYLSDHASWTNAKPNVLMPIIVGTYRYGNNTAAWRAWDDEIIAIQTSAPSAATVWRFAHHRSNIGSDSDPTQPNFWYEPRPNVSPDGRWLIFTSNWEKTLGTDPGDGTKRQDVFLLRLN